MAETAEGRDASTRNSRKGLSLQKECTFELPTVEAQEEPTYLNIGSILEH